MIKVSADSYFMKLTIACNQPSRDTLIQSFTCILHLLRPIKAENTVPCLETLEMLRYKLRCLQDQDDIFTLSPIEAYCYIQTLRYAIEHYKLKHSLLFEQAETVEVFIKQILETIGCVTEKKHDFYSVCEAPFAVSFIYIQYLNQIYENATRGLTTLERIELFLRLCKRIPIENLDTIKNDRHILPYGVFHDRCNDWMQRNGMEDICLEEVMEDESFMKI